MATLQQIRSRAFGLISQSEETSTDFNTSEMNGFANEGTRFLATLVKWPRDIVEIEVEDNTPAYELPRDALLIRTAYFGDVSIADDVKPLDILTEENLKELVPNWMDETESTKGRPRRIILLDRITVLINPRPNAAESGGGKKIHLGYVYLPAIMANDSDEPDLPIVYHDLVVDYVKYKCYSGKLNNQILADSTLKSIVERAKLLEPTVTKEFEVQAMTWGRADDPDADEGFGIVFG